MKTGNQICSYKIIRSIDKSISDNDFEFYPFDYFIKCFENPAHPLRRDHFFLLFVIKGRGYHIVDFQKYDLKAERAFLLAPGQVHSWESLTNVKGFVLLFTPEFFTSALQFRELRAYLFSNIAQEHTYLDLDKETSNNLQRAFDGISQDYKQLKKYSDHVCRSYINVILLELSRMCEQSIPVVDKNDVVFIKIREFEILVNKNFKTMHTVASYAALLCVTPNYLNAICQTRRGKTAGEIIRDRILLEARRLLIHSENSVSQIAYDLNFKDNSYFGRAFKKHYGQTPAQFRSEIKGKLISKSSAKH